MIRTPASMPVEQRSQMRGGSGDVTIRHLFSPTEFGANVRLCAQLTLPPGASIGPHTHEGEDEVYVILEGQGCLDDGTTRSTVTAGDAILTGQGATHAIANNGDAPLLLLAMIVLYPSAD